MKNKKGLEVGSCGHKFLRPEGYAEPECLECLPEPHHNAPRVSHADASSASPTPTPWKSDGSYVIGGDNLSVCKATIYKGTNEAKDIENETKAKANAAFIVRAVNAHEELLIALKELVDYASELEYDGRCMNDAAPFTKAHEAIAKAEGR
jgi:hypothetical protein